MKKISYFASLMLAVFMTTSCSDVNDNPVVPPTPEKTTTTITLDGVDYEADVVATFTGEIGKEVNLILGVYDRFDIYGVDFGDGKILTDTVCSENLGLKGEDGLEQPGTNHKSATTFTGTVAGEGMITVYSVAKSDIWYLKVEGNAMPTSLDQEKLLNVVQASFSGANVESVELPAMEKLTLFSFTNSPIKSLDISKATALTRIDIYNTTQSAFEPQLKEIDLSKNTELETVVLGGSTYKKGELTSLDFTNNTKLTQISAENNKLTAVTGIPVSVKNIYLTGNKLKELDLSGITNKGNIQIANNLFTLATLPTKPAVTTTSKYTYAPQPAYEVAEAITDQNNLLDLSSQLTATGVAAEPQTTTYTFLAGTTELKENEDYKVVEPGKFTFLKSQTEKVHAVMATDAFPKFTGKNAYVTTEFTVNVQGGASTSNIWSVPADYFTTPVTPDTKLFDNEFASAKTVFSATAAENKVSIAGIDFAGYIQLRVDADPTADTPTGTEKGGSTPFVITAKKDVTIKVYNRRQKGSNGYEAGDNKGLLCWDQAAAAKLSGTETFDKYEKDSEGNDNEDYGYVITSFKLSADKTYTLYRRGSTMRIFGIAFE